MLLFNENFHYNDNFMDVYISIQQKLNCSRNKTV